VVGSERTAGRLGDAVGVEQTEIDARRSVVRGADGPGERAQVRAHTKAAFALAERLRDRWSLASAGFDNARLAVYEGGSPWIDHGCKECTGADRRGRQPKPKRPRLTTAPSSQRFWLLRDLQQLISIDDSHWADSGTVAALRTLPMRLMGLPMPGRSRFARRAKRHRSCTRSNR
jgi:hypothetical protein